MSQMLLETRNNGPVVRRMKSSKVKSRSPLAFSEGPRQGEFRGKVLSLSDLEIPTEKLLTAQQERTYGTRVQNGFRRLQKLLPLSVAGYRLFLQQMAEVNSGSTVYVAWFPIRTSIEKDLLSTTRKLTLAERLVRRSHRKADRALTLGSRTVRKYPLDRETTFRWARRIAHSPSEGGPLTAIARQKKIHRILARTVQIMEEARDRMILPNFRLILKEVFHYQPMGMKRSDLFQEGILGLHRAVFRFDPTRLTRFSTYATYWIRQSIRKALIDRSRLIRVPQAIQEELRNPNTHLATEEVQRVRRIMRDTISISGGDDDASDDRLTPEMLEDGTIDCNENLHTGAIPMAVSGALSILNVREREVIRRRFGLEGDRIQTLEEIGESLHLSRERIRQIETLALNKMRRNQSLQEVYENLEGEGPELVWD